MARRFGSAMISNTDSTLFLYFIGHMLVKAYIVKEVGSFSAACGNARIVATGDRGVIPRGRTDADANGC